jgi:hypothetical protein
MGVDTKCVPAHWFAELEMERQRFGRVDENGLVATMRIWNYHFEAWDADQLRREHRDD